MSVWGRLFPFGVNRSTFRPALRRTATAPSVMGLIFQIFALPAPFTRLPKYAQSKILASGYLRHI
jgi:hypothetical protein